MKMTKIFVYTLCILCMAFGYVAESSGSAKVRLEFSNLATNLPTDWRPTAGDSLSFRVKVTKPPSYSGGDLTATLSDVTSYVGSCGNRLSPYNDLELRLKSNSGWRAGSPGVSLSRPLIPNPDDVKESVEYATVVVDCADYAAYGKLTFAAGGSTGAADPIYVIIPIDENENKIADCWKNDGTKNYVASADLDANPINANLGDHITVLDEYRGLYVNGSWTDTDPEAWDVFLRIESGLSSAASLPGTPHYMGLGEVDHLRGHVMPYAASNFGLGVSAVYAIRLRKDTTAFDREDSDNDVYGEIGMGPPSSGTHGDIWTERIGAGIKKGQTKSGITAYVVTHELGHGVSLGHCPNTTGLDCYMWRIVGAAAHHVTQYHSDHNEDYDLRSPRSGPQTPANVPTNLKRHYDPEKKTWSLKQDSSGSALLSPSGGLYAATPGSSHTADFTSTVAYSSVSWYVKTPSDTSAVLQRTDTGNGSSTSVSYTYTFPSGTSGDYVFRAKGTAGSTAFDVSYTVSVSTSTPTPTPTPTPPATPPSVSLAPRYYYGNAGDTEYFTLTLGATANYVFWYVQAPGQASPQLIQRDNSPGLTSNFSYWYPTGVIGDYVISVSGTWASDGSALTASYTAWVGSPTPE